MGDGEQAQIAREVADTLAELVSVTARELEVVEAPENRSVILLEDGVVVRRGGETTSVRFQLSPGTRIREGDSGEYVTHSGSFPVQVWAVEPDAVLLHVRVTPSVDIPVEHVRLEVDTSWLIEWTLNSLSAQLAGARRFHGRTGLQALARAPASKTPAVLIPDDAPLNRGQREAVAIATSQSPSFVWGPPGTGKTRTLAEVVAEFATQGFRVLVVANANVAVDTALLRTFEAVSHRSGGTSGAVVRFGSIAREDVRTAIGSMVLPDEIVKARFPEESAECRILESRLKAIEAQAKRFAIRMERAPSDLVEEVDQADLDADLVKNRQAMQDRRIDIQRQLEELAAHARDQRAALSHVLASLDRYEFKLTSHGPTRDRPTSGVTAEGTRKDDERLMDEREALRQEWREVYARLRALQFFLAEQERKVLREARIVFTTAWRSQLPEIADEPFDVVVIDEATTVPCPLLWLAASCATQRVVAIGDFRQIPPIDNEATRPTSGLKFSDDIFSLHRIPERVAGRTSITGLGVLTEQYRMPADLAAIVSAFAYPEFGLQTVGSGPVGSSLSPRAVITLDTAGRAPEPAQSGARRANPEHARLVVACIATLIQSGDVTIPSLARDVVVIAPYNDQVSHIREGLTRRFGRAAGSIVSTVHRMQGHERPYVVLDLVHGPRSLLGRLLDGSTLLDKGPRILNVAMSRAQRQLIVIADLTHLSGRGGDGSSSHIGSGLARLAGLLEPSRVDLKQLALVHPDEGQQLKLPTN
jgi:hypothetical protein